MIASFFLDTAIVGPNVDSMLSPLCIANAFISGVGTMLVGLVVVAFTHPDTRSQPYAPT